MTYKVLALLFFILFSSLSFAQPSSPESEFIKVDQFGYLPSMAKVAVISDPITGFNSGLAFQAGATYQLRNWMTDAVVFSGAPQLWNNGNQHLQSGDRGWWFDFSSVTTAGSYYVYDVANNVRSGRFEISDDVYALILKTTMRMFFYNRCYQDKQLPFAQANWTDSPAFAQDVNCRFVYDKNNVSLEKDLSGGWFDAGDFNKYVTFTDNPLHDLMWAFQENPTIFADNWDIPESGNGIPDILDEIKWELEWLLKMNNPDGSTHNKVGSQNYSENTATPPSLNTDTRYYGYTCSSASICVAGIFAHAAKVFENIPGQASFVQELETSAIASWNYVLPMLNTNTLEENCDEDILLNDGALDIISGDSDLSAASQRDKAIKAAIHLFDLTGDNSYNQYVIDNYASTEQSNAYWSAYKRPLNEALMHYTTLSNANAMLANTIIGNLTAAVDANSDDAFGFNNTDLYRAHMPSSSYHWGSNNPKAGYSLLNNLVIKYNIDPTNNASYSQKSASMLHYFHGVNPLGIVYLSNMYSFGAERSANEIYHQWFSDQSDWDNALTSLYGPAPGYVPGGPNTSYSGDYIPPVGQPEQKSYLDYNESSTANPSWEITEPSITYQGPFIRLLANFASATSACLPAGTTCDDGNPDTENDQEDGFCICAGIPVSSGVCQFVQNGTFDTDLSNWFFWGCNPIVNNGQAEISGITGGMNPWDAGFFQSNLPLENGKSYTIKFDGSAAVGRDMVLKIGLGVVPYTSFYTETITLGTATQQYTSTFTMSAANSNANIEFQLGADAATIFLDNVTLEELDCDTGCVDYVEVTAPVAAGLHEAAIELSSGSLINGPSVVDFRAGQLIELNADFETGTNVEFSAMIGNCGSN